MARRHIYYLSIYIYIECLYIYIYAILLRLHRLRSVGLILMRHEGVIVRVAVFSAAVADERRQRSGNERVRRSLTGTIPQK